MDQYRHWADALREGRGVETEPGNPRSGFYRLHAEAIAFWRDDNGHLLCWRSGKRPTPVHADEIDDLFSYCAKNPIPHEMFEAFCETAQWPEDAPRTPPAPLALPPHEAVAHEIAALKDLFSAWLAAAGRIALKADADKCANYADAFARLEKKAEAARQEQKAPFLAAGRDVDSRWKPVADEAAAGKRLAKKALEPYLAAERAKAIAAYAEAAEKRLSGPAAVTAGTQGRAVTLRTRQVNAIVDWPALFTYFASLNERPADLEAACQTVVNRMVAQGMTPPGVEIRRFEEAA
jgi:hypothetical protein